MDYSKLQVDPDLRYIHLGSDIGAEIAQELFSALLELTTKNKKPITLVINSTGGDVQSALAMYDAIRLCPAKVAGLVVGDCLSAALLIFQACNTRWVSPNSRLMLHYGYSGVGTQHGTDFKNEAFEELRINGRFDALLAMHSGQTPAVIKKLNASTTYLTAEEAVQKGFADRVVGESSRRKPAAKAKCKQRK